MGEALAGMKLKELKNLEQRIEKGISKIRSKKVFKLVTFSNNYLVRWWYEMRLNEIIHIANPNLFGTETLAIVLTKITISSFLTFDAQITEWAVVCWNWVYAEEGKS